MDLIQHEIPTTEKTTVSCSMGNPNTLNDSILTFSQLKDLSYLADNNDSNNSDKETDSFVILGKDSMDAIQASSLASYFDIQQKSMLVDYNSIVSSMATSEIHQKLSNLLQENTKLKETLKENNLAMKKQLTIMISWQEMVVKLHANYMEKFKETSTLVSNLKKQNLKLKRKLGIQPENIEHNSEKISNNVDNSNTSMLKPVSQELEVSVSSISESSISESSSFEKEKYPLINDQKSTSTMSQTEVTKCDNSEKISNNVDNSNTSMLKPVSQELEVSVSSISESSSFEKEKYPLINDQKSTSAMSQTEVTKCDNSERESLDIKKLIKEKLGLIDKYETLYDNSILEIGSSFSMEHLTYILHHVSKMSSIYNINMCTTKSLCWNDIDYENNRTHYNDLLSDLVQNLTDVLYAEINIRKHSSVIEDLLAEFQKEAFNEKTELENSKLMKKVLVQCRVVACVFKESDILSKTFNIVHALENMVKHIGNIFTDYWQNLNMMYLMMDEISKMTGTRDIVNDFHNDSQNEIEQKLNILIIQQNKLLKQEKDYKYRLQEFESKVINLNSNYQSLNDEKRRIQTVDEELKRRKNLYDGKVRTLLNEKLSLMQCREIDQTDLLKKYEEKKIECEKLQRELDQTISEISVYKNQISLYEEDFKQEKNMKESLLQEKNKLDIELQKQVNYNKQLTSTYPVEGSSQFSNKEVMSPCPKCERAFATLLSLTEHIEQCLNLD